MATSLLPAITELASVCSGAQIPSIATLDNVAEDQIVRVDEISTMLDAARDASRSIDQSMTSLLSNTQDLLAVFRAIDASEEAVGRVLSAVQITVDRLDVLQRAADLRAGSTGTGSGSGGGFKKLTSWLKGSRPAPLAADAPVTLPSWNPALASISADDELRLIGGALASCGGAVPPVSSGEAPPRAPAEPTTTIASGRDTPEASAVPSDSAPPDGAPEVALAPASPLSAPAAVTTKGKAAVAAGEDDEDDDESEGSESESR